MAQGDRPDPFLDKMMLIYADDAVDCPIVLGSYPPLSLYLAGVVFLFFLSLTRCTLLALLALLESKIYYVLKFKTSGGKNMISLNMFVPTLTLSLLARYVAALFLND